MNRTTLLILLLLLIALSAMLGFQWFEKSTPLQPMWKIGVLNYTAAAEPALEGFKSALHDRGYIEGTDVRFFYAGPISDLKRLKAEAERFNDIKVDLIFALSTPAATAAKESTRHSGIPVVFGPVSSPVKAGLISQMSRPGENITGVAFGVQEPRRLEMLLKIIPGVQTIFIPFNPDEQSPRFNVERLRLPAEKLGVSLILQEVRSRAELESALEGLPDRVDAVFMPADHQMVAMTDLLVEFCLENRLPLSTPHRQGVIQGALYSYGFSIREVGIQAARLAERILKGSRPGDLPVELTEFSLSLNLNTAEHLHLTIPEDLLRHAIIEKAGPRT